MKTIESTDQALHLLNLAIEDCVSAQEEPPPPWLNDPSAFEIMRENLQAVYDFLAN